MTFPSSPSEDLTSGILAALDLAIFERTPDGLFRIVGTVPQWFGGLIPEAAGSDAVDLVDIFPFLETFLAECAESPAPSGRVQSDIWTERDRQGQEHALQAMAFKVDGRFLLMIEAPAAAYEERRMERQRANETVLQNEKIERLRRELAHLNEELKARNQEVERATRAKSDFLAAMSHEIRTPMNAIIGMADLLDQTSLTAEQRKYVEVFQRAGENLLSLINDILDLSKVESGKVELESVDFDLAGVVSKAVEIIKVRAMTKGLQVEYAVAAGVPTHLIGDPGRLQQVLINLLGNSMKFTEEGGLRVAVELNPESNEPESLRFAVSDTGIGIPADKLDVIFEDFAQADSSTTRKYGGTGLGLSISRQLVALMFGRIWVTSEVGVGSTFYFTAKFGVRAEPKTPVPEARLALPAEGPVATGLRLLLVDDSEDNRFLIQSYLKDIGCSIETAENGRIAVEKFKNGKYDIVLMDGEMPEMDGYTAARLMREQERDTQAEATPVLALTAHAFQEAVTKSLQAGYTAHLTKPIRRTTLLEALSKYAPVSKAGPRQQKIHVTVDATLKDLVPNYLDKRRRELPKFTEALAAGDYATVRRLGHNLKGTGAGYGFPVLTDIGADIEENALRNNEPAIRAKVEELARYLADVEWSAAGDLTEA